MTENERDEQMLALVMKHATSGDIKDQNVIIAIGYLTGWLDRLKEQNKELRTMIDPKLR